MSKSFNKQTNTLSEAEIDARLIESAGKISDIKNQIQELNTTWKALKEDKDGLAFGNSLTANSLREEFQEKAEILKKQFNEAKDEYLEYKNLKNKLLTEAEIKLSTEDMFDPDKPVKFTDIAKRADDEEKAEIARKAEEERKAAARARLHDILDPVEKAIAADDDPDDILQILFDELVPPSGPAETVAGEIVRAIMRLRYRDYNDGDKFYEGYGLEACAASATYLANHGFADDLEKILEAAANFEMDDETYTEAIKDLEEKIIHEIIQDVDLFINKNEEDSLDQDIDWIMENQPKYSYEIPCSDDLTPFIEAGYCDSWKLKEYVENQLSWESSTRDAEIERPWGHSDTSVTITNLTKDGLDRVEELVRHHLESFWEDLVSELEEEHPRHECEDCGDTFFEDDMEEIDGQWICQDCGDSRDYSNSDDDEDLEEAFIKPSTLLRIFKSYCDSANEQRNPEAFSRMRYILRTYGDNDEEAFENAPEDIQMRALTLIAPRRA